MCARITALNGMLNCRRAATEVDKAVSRALTVDGTLPFALRVHFWHKLQKSAPKNKSVNFLRTLNA
jgi:hypothetical protein